MNELNSRTTVVSAFYPVPRDPFGHNLTVAQRLTLFRHTLALRVPLVLFLPSSLQDYVHDYRSGLPTTVIIRELDQLQQERLTLLEQNLHRERKEGQIPSYLSDTALFAPSYYPITFSKVNLLQEVAQRNPHRSHYFLWLDPVSFFVSRPLLNEDLEWPDPDKINILGERFLLPLSDSRVAPLEQKRETVPWGRKRVISYLLGGTISAINQAQADFWKETDYLLKHGKAPTEEDIWEILALQAPDRYLTWSPTRDRHGNLGAPTRDYMITYELAQGTALGLNYPERKQLLLLLISRKRSPVEALVKSAHHFGYPYQMVKAEKALEAIERSSAQYVIILRRDDFVLTGSADEFLSKLSKHHHSLWCAGQTSQRRHTIDDSFIWGERDKIVQYLALEPGVAELYLEQEARVDHSCLFCADLDRVQSPHHLELDPRRNRYRHKSSLQYPLLLPAEVENWVISTYPLTLSPGSYWLIGSLFVILALIILLICLSN